MFHTEICKKLLSLAAKDTKEHEMREEIQKRLLFEEEVYKIIGAAIEVHKELGPGFLELVYEEAMVLESKKRHIPHEERKEL